jgi:hypothetical protein
MEFNIDGPSYRFLRSFCEKKPTLLWAILTYCHAAPDANADLFGFLQKGLVPPGAFQISNTDRSVKRIIEETRLQDRLTEVRLKTASESISRLESWLRIKSDLTPEELTLVESTASPPRYQNLVSLLSTVLMWTLGYAYIGLYMDPTSWQFSLAVGLPTVFVVVRCVLVLSVMPKRLRLWPWLNVYGLLAGNALTSGLGQVAILGFVFGLYASLPTLWSYFLPVLPVLILLALFFATALISYLLFARTGLLLMLLSTGAALWQTPVNGLMPDITTAS